MKKWSILLFSLAFILSGSSAMAIGLGPYFGYDIGNMTLSPEDIDRDIDFDNKRFTIGFLLDSCTSQDSLFNYRLNIGYGVTNFSIDEANNDADIDGGGFDMKHTFGFGLVRNSAVRLWLGPALKLYVDAYSERGEDMLVFGIGGGPELGVNIHAGGLVSIGLTFGISYNFASATLLTDNGDDTESLTGSEFMYYFQISPIFNLGGDRDAWANAS